MAALDPKHMRKIEPSQSVRLMLYDARLERGEATRGHDEKI